MTPRASGACPALILRQLLGKYRPNQKPQIIAIAILTFASFQSKFSCSKTPQMFMKMIFYSEYQISGTTFSKIIFCFNDF